MSRSWRAGSTRAWRIIRAQVLARDGYLCQLKIDGICTTRATCVHHTLGRSITGDDPRYLTASCDPCNLHVGDPTKHDPQPTPRTRW